MSDIDPGLDALRLGEDAIPPVREGLPPRYRMRADAHYVEQLDSGLLNSPIRFLEVQGLEKSDGRIQQPRIELLNIVGVGPHAVPGR